MKKAMILFALAIFATGLYAQKVKPQDVPEPVKTAFAKLYAGVTVDKWEKEDGNFEAEFKKDGKEISVLFDAAGTLMQTEEEIAVSALPQAVADYVSKNLGGKKIDEASKITLADGTVNYEAEVGKKDYIFDAAGKFIKQDEEGAQDEDDEKEEKR
ncbi:MAG: PepSY-like domain-containing protein [Bacteroidetes bacterium]|nr:PepSY-like domain-containing protein [Bacteroidota bacterium]MBU1719741.1 PepSY-like domain-containing protein [Bacteroidota bacterium]